MRRRTTFADGGEGEAGAGAGGGGGESGAGGGEESWRETSGLSAEIRDHPTLARYADVPALAKGLLETKELVGRKGIILPKEGDAADLTRFRTEIGVPETVDGYDLGDFKPPEGLPWSDDFQATMLGKLHALGIPNGQIKELFSEYADAQSEQYQVLQDTAAKGHEQGTAKLKEDLGTDYEASTALAKRAFKAASGEHFDTVSQLMLADGTRLGDHPAFVRTFMNVGKQFSEHGLMGEKSSGGFTKTPEQAQAEIAKLESHPALHNADHPEHDAVVAKMADFYKQAYPETQPEVLE